MKEKVSTGASVVSDERHEKRDPPGFRLGTKLLNISSDHLAGNQTTFA